MRTTDFLKPVVIDERSSVPIINEEFKVPLVSISETKSRQNVDRLKTVLTNSRSVCNKAPLIQHYIMDNDIDIMFIT